MQNGAAAFSYTPGRRSVGAVLSVLREVVVTAREFSVPYESRLTVMLRTSRAIERVAYRAQRPPGS